MSTTRLVYLLRKAQELEAPPSVLHGQAADRIEQLEAALRYIGMIQHSSVAEVAEYARHALEGQP